MKRNTDRVHGSTRRKVDIRQQADILGRKQLPGYHGPLARKPGRQRAAGRHRLLPQRKGRYEDQAEDQRHEDVGAAPRVRDAAPRQRQHHEPEPGQEKELAARVDRVEAGPEPGRETGGDRGIHEDEGGAVALADGAGPDQLLAQDDEDKDDGGGADGEVDTEAPAPVCAGEVACVGVGLLGLVSSGKKRKEKKRTERRRAMTYLL